MSYPHLAVIARNETMCPGNPGRRGHFYLAADDGRLDPPNPFD